MAPTDRDRPRRIEQHDARTLVIEWGDGVTSLLDVRALRLACGCANCVDEWTGEALLAPDAVPEDVAPRSIQSVGRYAIQIQWSDGHDTGIYPFDRLRSLADRGLLAPSTSDTTSDTTSDATSDAGNAGNPPRVDPA